MIFGHLALIINNSDPPIPPLATNPQNPINFHVSTKQTQQARLITPGKCPTVHTRAPAALYSGKTIKIIFTGTAEYPGSYQMTCVAWPGCVGGKGGSSMSAAF